MSTTHKQDRDFIEEIMPSSLLESAIGFIRDEFAPEDIFLKHELERWAEENGYIKKEDQ